MVAMNLNLVVKSPWHEEAKTLAASLAQLGACALGLRPEERFDSGAPSLGMGEMVLFPGKGSRCGWLLDPAPPEGDGPALDAAILAGLDLLLVPSSVALHRAVGSSAPGLRLAVVSLGFDETVFRPIEPAYDLPYYTFLGLRGGGHKTLLQAFRQAFSPDEAVRLWLWDAPPGLTAAEFGGRKVSLVTARNLAAEQAELMNAADCGVLAAPGLDWSADLLRMMACERGAIAPMTGGHRDAVDETSCALYGSADELARQLRDAFEAGRGRSAVAREAALRFSSLECARRLLAVLSDRA